MFTSQKFSPFIEAVQKCFSNLARRNELVNYTVAWTLASELPLPSAPVEDPVIHFNNTSGLGLSSVISSINEVMIFDVREARELVRSFWMVRYNMLFPTTPDGLTPTFDFFCGVGHVGRYFTKEQHQVLAENSTAVYRVAEVLAACLKEA